MPLYKRAQTKVRVGNGMSVRFSIKVKEHQRLVLSPFLFATVMDASCE
jgi:hypothetical protein